MAIEHVDWSILIPTTPRRIATFFIVILTEVMKQVGDRPIEVLGLFDNKAMTVGEKRNALLAIARGRFVSFVDDDDAIAPDYVAAIHDAIIANPLADVIVYDHICTVNNQPPIYCRYGIELENRQIADQWTGKPSHTQTWAARLAKQGKFPTKSFGEDVEWVAQVWPHVRREVRLQKALYKYNFRTAVSETRG